MCHEFGQKPMPTSLDPGTVGASMHGTPVICYRAHAATKEPYRVVTLAERVCGYRDEASVYTAGDDRTMCRDTMIKHQCIKYSAGRGAPAAARGALARGAHFFFAREPS